MHYHLEVIMPPTQTVEEDLDKILSPLKGWLFDYYRIGDRFSVPGKPDVCLLSKINPIQDCSEPRYDTPSSLVDCIYHLSPFGVMIAVDCRAKYLIQQNEWNGVQSNRTVWDGSISSVIEAYNDEMQRCEAKYAERLRPKSDWISVTVDYHR